jgi:hypothetical protein
MILKNDYMSCMDYNLMKSLSNCLYVFVNFHHNEFFAISYVSLVIKGQIMIKKARGAKVKVLFQGLHITIVILVLVCYLLFLF